MKFMTPSVQKMVANSSDPDTVGDVSKSSQNSSFLFFTKGSVAGVENQTRDRHFQ